MEHLAGTCGRPSRQVRTHKTANQAADCKADQPRESGSEKANYQSKNDDFEKGHPLCSASPPGTPILDWQGKASAPCFKHVCPLRQRGCFSMRDFVDEAEPTVEACDSQCQTAAMPGRA